MILKYINKSYINNSSDILSFYKDIEFKKIISGLDENKLIKVTSHLIHKGKYINQVEQFIFNLDNYISFIKEKIFIKPLELRYIISLTLFNKNNKILYSDLYYYSNLKIYQKAFIKLFMYQYEKNIKIISKDLIIIKRDFNSLIKIINNKKRTYVYFEKITNNNMPFYLPIYEDLESKL